MHLLYFVFIAWRSWLFSCLCYNWNWCQSSRSWFDFHLG